MHPEIAHWGILHIRSYGLMLAVAFLLGTWLGLRESKRLGLDEDKVVNVILVVLIASVLGARALYVMEHVQEFRREWGSVLALWQGGLTLYGGIVAGTVAGLMAARRFGLPMWTLADALTPSLALGAGIGRIGCFLNGCCYGRPTTLPWGVVFPPDSYAGLEFGNATVHPSQLYLAGAAFLLFLLTWVLRKRVGPRGPCSGSSSSCSRCPGSRSTSAASTSPRRRSCAFARSGSPRASSRASRSASSGCS